MTTLRPGSAARSPRSRRSTRWCPLSRRLRPGERCRHHDLVPDDRDAGGRRTAPAAPRDAPDEDGRELFDLPGAPRPGGMFPRRPVLAGVRQRAALACRPQPVRPTGLAGLRRAGGLGRGRAAGRALRGVWRLQRADHQRRDARSPARTCLPKRARRRSRRRAPVPALRRGRRRAGRRSRGCRIATRRDATPPRSSGPRRGCRGGQKGSSTVNSRALGKHTLPHAVDEPGGRGSLRKRIPASFAKRRAMPTLGPVPARTRLCGWWKPDSSRRAGSARSDAWRCASRPRTPAPGPTPPASARCRGSSGSGRRRERSTVVLDAWPSGFRSGTIQRSSPLTGWGAVASRGGRDHASGTFVAVDAPDHECACVTAPEPEGTYRPPARARPDLRGLDAVAGGAGRACGCRGARAALRRSPAAPCQPGVRSHEHVRTRPAATNRSTRSYGTVGSSGRGRTGRALAAVEARVVDVCVEAVLVRGVASAGRTPSRTGAAGRPEVADADAGRRRMGGPRSLRITVMKRAYESVGGVPPPPHGSARCFQQRSPR